MLSALHRTRKKPTPGITSKHATARVATAVLLWVVGGATVGGCGYSHESLLPDNVHSIYVPIFDNDTFRRGLEFYLTDAIKNQILLKTDLRILPKEKADTILTGKIVDFREHVLIEDKKSQPSEKQVEIVIDFIWKDRRTGRVIEEIKGLRETAEFIIPRDETISQATAESFRYLAERVVESMEKDW